MRIDSASVEKPIGRLHVLTDTELQNRFSHTDLARLAAAGGADTIQYRRKAGSTRELIAQARALADVCRTHSVGFIVNDRIDVAIASGADGVHLGRDDFPIPLARQILGKEKLIGGSAATLEEARLSFEEGADYIGFGPVFPTDSKADAGPVSGLALLKKVVESFPVPIIAIGGIGIQNARDVIEAGAHGIAVISAVCCQRDPERATRALYAAVHTGPEPSIP